MKPLARGRRLVAFRSAAVLRAPRGSSDRLQGFQLMSTICAPQRSANVSPCFFLSATALSTAGCSTLPSSGPTGIGYPPRSCRQARPISVHPRSRLKVQPPFPRLRPCPVSTPHHHAAAANRFVGPGDVLDITFMKRASRCSGPSLKTAAAARRAVPGHQFHAPSGLPADAGR